MLVERVMRTAFATVLLLTGGATASVAENVRQSTAEDRLGRILNDWERQSVARTSLDIRFEQTNRDVAWGDERYFAGRVVLLPKGRALVEVVTHDKDGKVGVTDRLIWNDDRMHEIWPERKVHIIWPIDGKDRGRLPAVVALPFLWNVRIEGLKSRYGVELRKEDAKHCVLSFAPRSTADGQPFTRAYLWLDRVTYLPRRYHLISPNGNSSDYRVTETRCDQPVRAEDLRIPVDEGWEVIRADDKNVLWFSQHLIKLDLLP